MKFIADNNETVALFTTLCKNYANYEWAVAWAGEVNGFDMANILSANENKIRKLVVGLHFYQTAPSFIRRFISNKQVRFVLQSDGTFHSKVYLFYNSSSDWAAIVGSMNFTTSAFHKNSEAGICISSKDASVDTFNQIRNYIASIWENGKMMSEDDLSAYTGASNLQQSKLDSLRRLEVLSNKVVVSSLDVMTWPEYYKAMLENETFDYIITRLDVLKEARAFFKSYKHFDTMPLAVRQCIAGIDGSMGGHSNVEHWQLFGNMVAAGYYKSDIINNAKLGKALDIIPLEGAVSEAQFNEYCQPFFDYYDNPLACATRLLAIKRPDLFICIDSKNKQILSDILGIPKSKMTIQNYWNLFLKRLYASPWYQDNTLAHGIEALAKKYRVAMLDAICYRHSADDAETNENVESWLLPYNENKFRFMDWLKTHDYVFWRQNVNLKPNDIVYIYGSTPIRAIVCALQVDSIDYPDYADSEEKQYWCTPDSLTACKKYAKLNVLAIPEDREALSFENLHDHGLKVPPQGGMKLRGDLKDYINSIFL